ncbi:hypothetical protein TNCV_3623921 [Trichonephila clavipes]|nr:hypothetical protein TNCV_3623921 [Trichonephila clavipes]
MTGMDHDEILQRCKLIITGMDDDVRELKSTLTNGQMPNTKKRVSVVAEVPNFVGRCLGVMMKFWTKESISQEFKEQLIY